MKRVRFNPTIVFVHYLGERQGPDLIFSGGLRLNITEDYTKSIVFRHCKSVALTASHGFTCSPFRAFLVNPEFFSINYSSLKIFTHHHFKLIHCPSDIDLQLGIREGHISCGGIMSGISSRYRLEYPSKQVLALFAHCLPRPRSPIDI